MEYDEVSMILGVRKLLLGFKIAELLIHLGIWITRVLCGVGLASILLTSGSRLASCVNLDIN